MTQQPYTSSQADPHKWTDRWNQSVDMIDESERKGFIGRILSLAKTERFKAPVKLFLEQASYAHSERLRAELRDFASEKKALSVITPDLAYQFGMAYKQILSNDMLLHSTEKVNAPNKKFLNDAEANVMAFYLARMAYPDAIKDKVAQQSSVVSAVANVLQFDQGIDSDNWLGISAQERAAYLEKVSKVSDYILQKRGLVSEDDSAKIVLNTNAPDGIVYHYYNEENDVIELYDDGTIEDAMMSLQNDTASFGNAIMNLQNAKASRMIAKEIAKEKMVNPLSDVSGMKRLEVDTLAMFVENAEATDMHTVYSYLPQGRLARSAEMFKESKKMTVERREDGMLLVLQGMGTTPMEFAYVDEAVERIAKDIDAQRAHNVAIQNQVMKP